MIPPVSTGVVFGPAKRFKTSMLVGAFPRALFIGAPPAIRLIAENEWGFTPTIWPFMLEDGRSVADVFGLPSTVETLPDLYAILDMLNSEGYAGSFDAIVNDDLTPIAKRSVRMWKLEGVTTTAGYIDNFYPYQQLDGFMVDVAGLTRNLGCHGWSTAWLQPFTVNMKTKKPQPGGPAVGSAAQSAQLPGWFDVNVEAIQDPEYPDPWMRGALRADVNNAQMVTGDRNGVAINGIPVPPNIRELLRASRTPYVLQRIPSLEWQDELADEVAEIIVATGPRSKEVFRKLEQTFGGSIPEFPRTVDELHLRWGCQDGIARGVLRLRMQRATISEDAFTGAAAGGRPGRPVRPSRPARPGQPAAEAEVEGEEVESAEAG